MAAPEPAGSGRGRGRVALAFALAALASCWNALAAPVALIVGSAAVVLAVRALRRAGDRRRVAAAALACSVAAVVGSVVTLALTAGAVSLDLPGEAVVKTRSPEQVEEALSGAGERTRALRDRARRELDAIPRTDGVAGRPQRSDRDGGTGPADAGAR